MTMFTGRAFVPERMDEPDAPREELAEALRFIRMVNRRLGGTAALLRRLDPVERRLAPGAALRLVDLGTGSADIPLAAVRWGAARGRRVEVVGLDSHPTTLELAREHLAGQADEGERRAIELVEGDARCAVELLGSGGFDVAHAGMFLHHLTDLDAVGVLGAMSRLARRAVVWNDLVRDRLSRVAVRVITLGMPEAVRFDAVVSVDKGFRRGEALDLARRAGLRSPRWRRHVFGRFTLTAPGGPD